MPRRSLNLGIHKSQRLTNTSADTYVAIVNGHCRVSIACMVFGQCRPVALSKSTRHQTADLRVSCMTGAHGIVTQGIVGAPHTANGRTGREVTASSAASVSARAAGPKSLLLTAP